MRKASQFLFFTCISLCFLFCRDRHSIAVEQAKAFLENKYHEPFEVSYWNELTMEQPRHELFAWPVKNRKMGFNIYIHKKSGEIEEYYQDAVWRYEATYELRKYLQSDKIKFGLLVLAGVPNSDEILKGGKILSFAEATGFPKYHPGVVIDLYIFKDYHSNKTEVIHFLQKILDFYTDKNISDINFRIEFYDEDFFKNINVDTLTYWFGGDAPRPYDNAFEFKEAKQSRERLNFEVINGKPLPSTEELEKLMK